MLVLATCSFSASVGRGRTLGIDEVEQKIAKSLQEATGVAVTLACPDDATIEQDEPFECTATAEDGSSHTVKVTPNDAEDTFSWAVVP
ncbi:MAG: DUF4333 domain-containing protein [Egibacteraceae bacterium]